METVQQEALLNSLKALKDELRYTHAVLFDQYNTRAFQVRLAMAVLIEKIDEYESSN